MTTTPLEPAYSPLKILLVDGSSAVRTVYGQLLKKAGYAVELAEGIEEALQRASDSPPDICVFDYFLPDGSGLELVRGLHGNEQSRNTLVVIHTERRHAGEITLATGTTDLIYKDDPVDIFLLRIAAMERYIRVQQSNREMSSSQSQVQFAAFQQGIAEMSANILHNVGNTIQGMRASYEALQQHLGEISQVEQLYRELIDNLHAAEQAQDQPSIARLQQTLVEAGHELPEALNNLLQPAQRCFQRLGKGIDHVTEVIRIQQQGVHPVLQFESFSPRQLVDDLLVLVESEFSDRNIALKLWRVPVFPQLHLPRNQLLQALVNLLKNSAEAVAEAIGQQLLEADQGRVELEMEITSAQLHIVVRDNGIGFSPRQRAQMMQFGFTTKSRGNGFGLHSVGNFVAQCKGEVVLHSRGEGQGAEISISLPLLESDG